MARAVIADAIRTPMGRAHKGSLASVRPDDLGGWIAKEMLKRHPDLDPALIDDLICANAMPEAEQGMNMGRGISQIAGLPDHVPGMTINRFCASGLEAVAVASNKIEAGVADIILVVGAESMSMVPMGGHDFRPNPKLSRERPGYYLNMGLTAERLATNHSITRMEQDAFSLRSHERALAAEARGDFKAERRSIALSEWLGPKAGILEVDETPRPGSNLEDLAKLRPSFSATGSVTPGNSSPLTDGAAAALVCSEEVAARLGIEPLGRLASYATRGVDPEVMGIGPVAAVPLALKMAGWSQGDLDQIELNEAFAAQALAVIRVLGLDEEKVNPYGGAIAMGHPLGCTGTKLTATLLHGLARQKKPRGMVTMCVGGGMGAAGCFERL